MSHAGQERQPAADLGQHLVAGIVTEGIVDLFEVVQVDEQHRQPAGWRSRASSAWDSRSMQRDAVRQPGDRVVKSLIGERFLGLDLCCHIAGDAERADDPAALVAKRHLGGRNPGAGSVAKGLPLQLPDDGFARCG